MRAAELTECLHKATVWNLRDQSGHWTDRPAVVPIEAICFSGPGAICQLILNLPAQRECVFDWWGFTWFDVIWTWCSSPPPFPGRSILWNGDVLQLKVGSQHFLQFLNPWLIGDARQSKLEPRFWWFRFFLIPLHFCIFIPECFLETKCSKINVQKNKKIVGTSSNYLYYWFMYSISFFFSLIYYKLVVEAFSMNINSFGWSILFKTFIICLVVDC